MPDDDQLEPSLTRTFAWSNMFVAPEDDPRSQAPVFGERATLTDYLRAYRQTLRLKCEGLDAEQMARRSVPPSNLSLLGIVRHMADCELFWFRRVMTGADAPRPFRLDDDRDAAFNGASPDPATVEQAWSAWRSEVEFAERFVEEAPSLDITGRLEDPAGEEIALREVLVHMIEEYARHCGHADLIRERIDGRVGQ
jgi:uncharacterized damage-inducible protein DinB